MALNYSSKHDISYANYNNKTIPWKVNASIIFQNNQITDPSLNLGTNNNNLVIESSQNNILFITSENNNKKVIVKNNMTIKNLDVSNTLTTKLNDASSITLNNKLYLPERSVNIIGDLKVGGSITIIGSTATGLVKSESQFINVTLSGSRFTDVSIVNSNISYSDFSNVNIINSYIYNIPFGYGFDKSNNSYPNKAIFSDVSLQRLVLDSSINSYINFAANANSANSIIIRSSDDYSKLKINKPLNIGIGIGETISTISNVSIFYGTISCNTLYYSQLVPDIRLNTYFDVSIGQVSVSGNNIPVNNSFNIGSTNYKFNEIISNTFVGDLSGAVSSANDLRKNLDMSFNNLDIYGTFTLNRQNLNQFLSGDLISIVAADISFTNANNKVRDLSISLYSKMDVDLCLNSNFTKISLLDASLLVLNNSITSISSDIYTRTGFDLCLNINFAKISLVDASLLVLNNSITSISASVYSKSDFDLCLNRNVLRTSDVSAILSVVTNPTRIYPMLGYIDSSLNKVTNAKVTNELAFPYAITYIDDITEDTNFRESLARIVSSQDGSIVVNATAAGLTYEANTSYQTWDLHRANAVTLGGSLAVILNATQNEQVRVVAAATNVGSAFFIGAVRTSKPNPPYLDKTSDYWQWTNGATWSYTNFGGNEPNNSGNNEPFVELFPSNGIWNDIYSFVTRPAVYMKTFGTGSFKISENNNNKSYYTSKLTETNIATSYSCIAITNDGMFVALGKATNVTVYMKNASGWSTLGDQINVDFTRYTDTCCNILWDGYDPAMYCNLQNLAINFNYNTGLTSSQLLLAFGDTRTSIKVYSYTGGTWALSNGIYSVVGGSWSTTSLLSFTTVGETTFTAPTSGTVEVLIVGGGGGGGTNRLGGGGGGGGVIYMPSVSLTAGTGYQIIVGNGGPPGSNGQNSRAFGAIAAGGGSGADGGSILANSGGSGGGSAINVNNKLVTNPGGGFSNVSTLGTNSGTIYGNRGGNMTSGVASNVNTYRSAGGGGAGSQGVDTNPIAPNVTGTAAQTSPSAGGAGIMNPILGPTYYWGGGGGGGASGGINNDGLNGGWGGIGGGGAGGNEFTTYNGIGGGSALNSGSNPTALGSGGNGGANTGGGGGGSGSGGAITGSGGSGIVVIRYNTFLRAHNATTAEINNNNFGYFVTLSQSPSVLGFTVANKFYTYNCTNSDGSQRGSVQTLPSSNGSYTNIIAFKMSSDAEKIIVSNTYYVFIYKWNINNWSLLTTINLVSANITANIQVLRSITGATVTTFSSYTIYSYKTIGNSIFIPAFSGTVEVLLVGGGGGGGSNSGLCRGGGGGGGGVVYMPNVSVNIGQRYNIVVGGGGLQNTNGQDTTAFGAIAAGGGNGGVPVGNGGSGGGASADTQSFKSGGISSGNTTGPNSGTTYGNSGGNNMGYYDPAFLDYTARGAGGGGAGSAGTNTGIVNGELLDSGHGGAGVMINILGTNYYWGGGGGGASLYGGGGSGGIGGGGGGSVPTTEVRSPGGGSALNPGTPGGNANDRSGLAVNLYYEQGEGGQNTGGGGGGAGFRGGSGGPGGSGIVIIRHLQSLGQSQSASTSSLLLTLNIPAGPRSLDISNISSDDCVFAIGFPDKVIDTSANRKARGYVEYWKFSNNILTRLATLVPRKRDTTNNNVDIDEYFFSGGGIKITNANTILVAPNFKFHFNNNNKNYTLATSNLDWSTHNNTSNAKLITGREIASIENEADNELVKITARNNLVWIGGMRTSTSTNSSGRTSTDWQWSDLSSTWNYTSFAGGEPNRFSETRIQSLSGTWYDTDALTTSRAVYMTRLQYSLNTFNIFDKFFFHSSGFSSSYANTAISTTVIAKWIRMDSPSTLPIEFRGNGDLVSNGKGIFTVSDIRLKENIVDSTPKLEDLLKVRVVNYNLKGSKDNKLIGVVAQELEQLFPTLVNNGELSQHDIYLGKTESYKSVKYSCFDVILIKAFQEQVAIINKLTSQLDEIDGKTKLLKAISQDFVILKQELDLLKRENELFKLNINEILKLI